MTGASQRFTARGWMAAAFCVGLAVFALARLTQIRGADLGATARWSFVLFWLGSTGGALARLFGPTFDELARRARDLSLAYAAAQLVHLGIVVRVLYTSPQPASELLFFGMAVFWTYLLAAVSLTKLSVRLDPRVWRILRTVGVEYIALAFLVDFARYRFDGGFFNAVYYLPFLVLAIAAPALRLAAFVKRTIEKKRTLVGSPT
jgi:hypothetical protein